MALTSPRLTKYDCSSADINPIGSISKEDIRAFQRWALKEWDLPILEAFIEATPSAELLPLSAGIQSDEEEMVRISRATDEYRLPISQGLTYSELSMFGMLRKVDKLGPWSTYERLLLLWQGQRTPEQISEKVMHFFRTHTLSRHNQTVL